jgi:hypothetical protein
MLGAALGRPQHAFWRELDSLAVALRLLEQLGASSHPR